MFSFASGKLRRSYDESLEAAAEVQKSGSAQFKLDPIDFGRRMAVVRASASVFKPSNSLCAPISCSLNPRSCCPVTARCEAA